MQLIHRFFLSIIAFSRGLLGKQQVKKRGATKTLGGPVFNGIENRNIPVALYFDGNAGNLYQLEQWLTVLDVLSRRYPVCIVLRNAAVIEAVMERVSFPVVHCQKLDDLVQFHETHDIKCTLYVNNAMKNFQSLIYSGGLHVHINHGESEKISTMSNQAKSYDYVFIVAQAARDKYLNSLMKVDPEKFIQVGRPQLENIRPLAGALFEKIRKGAAGRKVVIYAPTWEGTHAAMNYTSLGDSALRMVEQLLAASDIFLIYKPHPNTGSRLPEIGAINQKIITQVEESGVGLFIPRGDINSLFPLADAGVFDSSAVTIDWLVQNKPMLMLDIFSRSDSPVTPPITAAGARLLAEDGDDVAGIVMQELASDSRRQAREELKKYFLGEFDYASGESTQAFIDAVGHVIDERDTLLAARNAKQAQSV